MNEKIKPYFQPAFIICAVVLAAAGVSKQTVIKLTGAYLIKKPLPLKKPLDLLDESKLKPYKVINKTKITNADILESLGTEDYIQWTLEDTEAAPDSPTRYCSLFITYYTGNPDQVPHVPEECYIGGGNEQKLREELLLHLKKTASKKAGSGEFKVRHLVFVRKGREIWEKDKEFSVIYFFKINDKYANSRASARKILIENLFGKYSYFSKVEWKFFGEAAGQVVFPDKEQVIASSEKLLDILLPVLEREHWPDWPKAGNGSNEQKSDN